MPLHVYVFLLVVCLLLCLARLGRLDWFHLWPSSSRGVVKRTTLHRLLKPRTPDDCPACQRASTLSLGGGPAPAPVRPWREVKSRRGAPKRIPTEGFACPNQQCLYFGITDAHRHALVGDGKHGQAEQIQTFRCQACRTTFTARRNTPLYRLKTPSKQIAVVLSALAEGLDPSAAARVFGYRQATISTWLTRAGKHAELFHKHTFRNLHLPHLQLDEIRTRLRSAKQVLWLWLAIDPLTKILPALELGSRTQHRAHVLIHSLKQTLAPGCIPLFTSDGLNLYFYALTAHFGQWLAFGRRGRSVRRWQVAASLIYGQVKKCYQRRKLVRVRHVMRLGTEADLTAALQGLGLSGRWHAAPGPRRSSPHACLHTWNGGARTITLSVHTNRYAWRSCSLANEEANVWRNAIDNGRRRWQPAERPDDGRRARYSPAHCHSFPLESQENQVQVQCHVAR